MNTWLLWLLLLLLSSLLLLLLLSSSLLLSLLLLSLLLLGLYEPYIVLFVQQFIFVIVQLLEDKYMVTKKTDV